MQIRVLAILCLAAALGGCIGGYDLAHPNVISNVQPTANPSGFRYCGGWGCSDPHAAAFTEDEWQQVTTTMMPPAATAEAERAQIGEAIGLMERLIAPKFGYDRDLAGTGAGVFRPGQLDCYSEATNTSNFLHLLNNAGFLRFHEPADPIMRGMATSRSWRGTHATATVIETASAERIAVDSWFFENGHAAVYVDADTWAKSWAPEGGASL